MTNIIHRLSDLFKLVRCIGSCVPKVFSWKSHVLNWYHNKTLATIIHYLLVYVDRTMELSISCFSIGQKFNLKSSKISKNCINWVKLELHTVNDDRARDLFSLTKYIHEWQRRHLIRKSSAFRCHCISI